MPELPEDWIRERAAIADGEPLPPIDVSRRVSKTLARNGELPAGTDTTPLVLGGGLVVLSAAVVLMLFSNLAAVSGPWVGFWLF